MSFASLVMCFGLAVAFAEEAPKYPFIETFAGDAKVQTGRDGKLASPKPHQLLRESAVLVTGKNGLFKLQLGPTTRMEVRAGSRVELPGISWENGAVPEVDLRDGRIRWTPEKPESTVLKSPLFELTPPGGDYLLEFDRTGARAEAQVLKGELHFGALNGEDSVTLKENQKASFQGLLQDGEIAYDVLLKGRRIPRGTLSPVSALTADDLAPFREADAEAARQKHDRERSAQKKAQEIAKRGTICQAPAARFNECAWTCEGLRGTGHRKGAPRTCQTKDVHVSCVRRRCDANGKWTDAFTLPADEGGQRCTATPLVAACDY